MEKITIAVDCHGEWIENNNLFTWRLKECEDDDILENREIRLITVKRDILYDDFVNTIISRCRLNCRPEDVALTFVHSSWKMHNPIPCKIRDQDGLVYFLNDASNSILRVYMVGKKTRNDKSKQVLVEEKAADGVNLDIPICESENEVDVAEFVQEQADPVDEPTTIFVEETPDFVEEQADIFEEQADIFEEQADIVVEDADIFEEQADIVEEQSDFVEEQVDLVDDKPDIEEDEKSREKKSREEDER